MSNSNGPPAAENKAGRQGDQTKPAPKNNQNSKNRARMHYRQPPCKDLKPISSPTIVSAIDWNALAEFERQNAEGDLPPFFPERHQRRLRSGESAGPPALKDVRSASN